jgi:hypothetical protein
MANINPFSLINNPRLTPSLPDHSAVQKLLTDSHVQGMKDKAAAARNLQTIQGSVANALMNANVDPSPVYRGLKVNIPNLGNILSTRDALQQGLTKADTASKWGSAAESQLNAGILPQITSGPTSAIVGGPQTATSEKPVERQIVTTNNRKEKGMEVGGVPLGATEVTTTSGQKQTGPAPVGQVTKSLPAILAGKNKRWDMIKLPVKRTADYLKITPEQLMQKIEAGLLDGSVQLIGTKQIVIDGQPFTWFN